MDKLETASKHLVLANRHIEHAQVLVLAQRHLIERLRAKGISSALEENQLHYLLDALQAMLRHRAEIMASIVNTEEAYAQAEFDERFLAAELRDFPSSKSVGI